MITREMQLKIKIRLLEKGLTQISLCRQFNITPPYLNRMINGTERPRPDVASYLAEMIGVTVNELIGKSPGQAA